MLPDAPRIAFEADLGFSLRDPDRTALIPKRIVAIAKKFVQSRIGPDLLCPEQMSELLKEYDTMDELVHSLLHKQSGLAALPFTDLVEKYTALWSKRVEVYREGLKNRGIVQGGSQILRPERAAFVSDKGSSEDAQSGVKPTLDKTDFSITSGMSELLDAFRRIQPSYKAAVKGDFEKQIEALASSYDNPLGSFRQLLREKGSLFNFLAPSNRKVNAKGECPPFF